MRLVQTSVGRAAVLVVYALLTSLSGDWLKWIAALVLVPVVLFPARRRMIIAMSAAMLICLRPYNASLEKLAHAARVPSPSLRAIHIGASVAALAACAAVIYFVSARPGSLLGKRPVAAILTLFTGSVAAASLLPVGEGALRLVTWALLAAIGSNLWFLCYSLKNRAPRTTGELLVEVGHYNPFWAGSAAMPSIPMPKNGRTLDRIEEASPQALAVWQLKGLKLILWAVLLTGARHALTSLVYGTPTPVSRYLSLLGLHSLGVPHYEVALARSAAGAPLPFYTNWGSLAAHFFLDNLLAMAIAFHFAIGTCRIAGFRAPRGMYRPLSARSLADFWNRVHFYFKELMVELFFFPTFLRWFRRYPRLRLFAATFAAAGVGNFLYHFLRDFGWVPIHGFWATVVKWQNYALYTVILAVAIGISQLRGQKRPAREPPRALTRVATIASILAFYCVLGVLDNSGGYSIRECGRFVLNLFPSWIP